VEDEWEREIESDEDLDLLFVTYRSEKVKMDQLEKTIEEHGFAVEVKEEQ
jgi:hypothetical protein